MLVGMHQPHYLPWVGYLDKMARSDLFVFVDHVQFERKGWQNRNFIKSSVGPLMLSLPVFQRSRSETICLKQIDNSRPWRRKHIKSIKSAYDHAPFFESQKDILYCIEQSGDSFTDLSIELTLQLARAFGIHTPTIRSSHLVNVTGKKTDMIINLCRKLGADGFLSGDGAATYLDVDAFGKAGIALCWQRFVHAEYSQQFPELGFVPRLTALDLLFNEGPSGYYSHIWSENQ
jgi:hypothetical protein